MSFFIVWSFDNMVDESAIAPGPPPQSNYRDAPRSAASPSSPSTSGMGSALLGIASEHTSGMWTRIMTGHIKPSSMMPVSQVSPMSSPSSGLLLTRHCRDRKLSSEAAKYPCTYTDRPLDHSSRALYRSKHPLNRQKPLVWIRGQRTVGTSPAHSVGKQQSVRYCPPADGVA